MFTQTTKNGHFLVNKITIETMALFRCVFHNETMALKNVRTNTDFLSTLAG